MINLEQLEAELSEGENVRVSIELTRTQWALIARLCYGQSRKKCWPLVRASQLQEVVNVAGTENDFGPQTRKMITE